MWSLAWSLAKDHVRSTKNQQKLEEALLLLKVKGFLNCGLPSYRQLRVPFLPKLLGSSSKTKGLWVHDKYTNTSIRPIPITTQTIANWDKLSKSPLLFSFFPGLVPLLCTQPIGMRRNSRLNFHRGSARRSFQLFVLAWETKDSTRPIT